MYTFVYFHCTAYVRVFEYRSACGSSVKVTNTAGLDVTALLWTLLYLVILLRIVIAPEIMMDYLLISKSVKGVSSFVVGTLVIISLNQLQDLYVRRLWKEEFETYIIVTLNWLITEAFYLFLPNIFTFILLWLILQMNLFEYVFEIRNTSSQSCWNFHERGF